MGGISFIIYNTKHQVLNSKFISSFDSIISRGPDGDSYNIYRTEEINKYNKSKAQLVLSRREMTEFVQYNFVSRFARLSINDESLDAMQPFVNPMQHKIREYPDLKNRLKRTLICNGEIYNYKQLKNEIDNVDKELESNCDVEIILPLYIKYGLEETLKKLNGDFSFILTENLETYNLKEINIYAVRDILGIKPLYMIKHVDRIFYMFVSELKAIPEHLLNDDNYKICEVPPGTYWSFNNSVIKNNEEEFIRYHDWNNYRCMSNCTITNYNEDNMINIYSCIREHLTNSIISRFNLSDVPVGILLSGGFDSSIILSILVKYLISINHDFNKNKLYVFTIGNMKNADVMNAQKLVKYIEDTFNIDILHDIVTIDDEKNRECLINDIDDIIYCLETYDKNVIRQSIPFYKLLKYINNQTPVKVLLTGEGLDELCGYKKLINKNDEEFHKYSIKMLKYISKFDIMRNDKIASKFSLELRHPFLDEIFIKYMLSLHPKFKKPYNYKYGKGPIEKYIIRKAFDKQYLPIDILWRKMQDISESFNTKSFTFLNEYFDEYFNKYYSDNEFQSFTKTINNTSYDASSGTSEISIKSKEEMYYFKTFNNKFKNCMHLIPLLWNNILD